MKKNQRMIANSQKSRIEPIKVQPRTWQTAAYGDPRLDHRSGQQGDLSRRR